MEKSLIFLKYWSVIAVTLYRYNLRCLLCPGQFQTLSASFVLLSYTSPTKQLTILTSKLVLYMYSNIQGTTPMSSLNSICSINTFIIVLLQHKLAEEKSRTFSGHMSGQVPWTALAVEMSSCLLVTVKFYKCKKDRRKIYGANLGCACFHRHV